LNQAISVRCFLVTEIASFLQKLIKKSQNTLTESFTEGARCRHFDKLTGAQYSEKVAENCVAYWKAVSVYTDPEAAEVDKLPCRP
jgi:chalcone isomerase